MLDIRRLIIFGMMIVFTGCLSPVAPDPDDQTPGGPESRTVEEQLSTRPFITEEALSAASVEIPRAGRSESRNPVLSAEQITYHESALREVAELRDAEDYERALDLLRSVLNTATPEPYKYQLRGLEVDVKRLLLNRVYLSAFVEMKSPRWVIGDVIEGDVVLMNISDDEMVIPALSLSPPQGQGGENVPSLVLLRTSVLYREYQPDYTVVERTNSLNYKVDQDIVLAPGETRRFPIVIDTMEINPSGTMLRVLDFSCELHSIEIRVGLETFAERIVFTPSRVQVFPRNAEHLARNPAGRIREAIEKNAPLHLTLAAAFVEEGDRISVLQFLRAELERSDLADAVGRGIMTALRILTAQDFPCDKRTWLRYLKQEIP